MKFIKLKIKSLWLFATILILIMANTAKLTKGQIAFRTKDTVFVKSDSIVFHEYCLKVLTYYLRDSVNKNARRIFNPMISNQTLLFKKNGVVIKKLYNRSKKIIQADDKGIKKIFLSEVYYAMYPLSGRFRTFFVIKGMGGCNSCPETLDFYTLNGGRPFDQDTDFDAFLKKYGITDYNKSNQEIQIYPFLKR